MYIFQTEIPSNHVCWHFYLKSKTSTSPRASVDYVHSKTQIHTYQKMPQDDLDHFIKKTFLHNSPNVLKRTGQKISKPVKTKSDIFDHFGGLCISKNNIAVNKLVSCYSLITQFQGFFITFEHGSNHDTWQIIFLCGVFAC